MGQQQLLLLVLSTFIVSLAILMGFSMFGENAAQANQNAVTTDVLSIASRAQRWYRRPIMLGGGGRSFANVSLDTLQFGAANENGNFAVTVLAGGDSLQIVGTGNEDIDDDGSPLSVTLNIGANEVADVAITQ